MELFTFNGDWNTTILLPIFSKKLDNPSFGHHMDKEIKAQDRFRMRIVDTEDDSPEPTAAQMAAIWFVQQHQEDLLKSVFEYHQSVLFPHFKEVTGFSAEENPEFYPPFETVANLKNVVGFSELIIETLEKDGLAYFTLGFDWLLDQEHGLCVQMHGIRVIGHGGWGNLDGQKILEDLGINPQEQQGNEHEADQSKVSQDRIKSMGIYQPNSKYGKLKPWQEDANRYYPFGLLHDDDIATFKAFFGDEKNEQYWQVDELLSVAAFHQKQLFIEFLIGLGPKDVYASLCRAISNADLPLMKKLLAFEKDINKQRGQESYLYKLMGQLYQQYADPQRKAIYKEAIRLFIEQGANPYLQERWTRNAFFCLRNFDEGEIKQEIKNYVAKLSEEHGRMAETVEPANQDTSVLLQRLMAQDSY